MNDISRRPPLEPQCSLYQVQQGDDSETIKPVLRGTTSSDGCGRNASIYQVFPVCRITREGRGGVLKGRGDGGTGG